MKKLIGLLVLLSIISISCEKSSNPYNTDTYLMKPIDGIYPENHFGITSVGYGALNPLKPSTVIAFSVPERTEVTLWIVPIKDGNDESIGYTNVGGGSIVAVESAQAVFFMQDTLDAGAHAIEWNAQDEQGNRIPGGWYRVYLTSSEYFTYRDMFFWYSVYDM